MFIQKYLKFKRQYAVEKHIRIPGGEARSPASKNIFVQKN